MSGEMREWELEPRKSRRNCRRDPRAKLGTQGLSIWRGWKVRIETVGKSDKQYARKVLCREDYGEESITKKKKKSKHLEKRYKRGYPRVASPAMTS